MPTPKHTIMERNPDWYTGASWAKNSCGPMMFPAQYAMKTFHRVS